MHALNTFAGVCPSDTTAWLVSDKCRVEHKRQTTEHDLQTYFLLKCLCIPRQARGCLFKRCVEHCSTQLLCCIVQCLTLGQDWYGRRSALLKFHSELSITLHVLAQTFHCCTSQARFYTCETDEPSAADIAAHLQKQRPQLVLIQEQHCQAADLQETLAKAGYFQLLKADTGSIFAADDVLVGLEGAISGQASNTQLIGRDSAAGSSSGSSSSWDRSVIEGQQAGGKQQRNVRIRLSGGSGQGSGSGAGGGSSGGGSGNGGGGGQHGSGPPSPDDGGSSSGGDQAGSSQGNAGSAVTGAHAACQSADCGRLKLQLSKKVCASSHGQGSASIDNLVDGSTDLRTLRFTGVFDEGSKGLTGSAAWKLKDWPRLPLAPQAPSQGQQSTQHEFFVDLAVNMCRHENQVRGRFTCA